MAQRVGGLQPAGGAVAAVGEGGGAVGRGHAVDQRRAVVVEAGLQAERVGDGGEPPAGVIREAGAAPERVGDPGDQQGLAGLPVGKGRVAPDGVGNGGQARLAVVAVVMERDGVALGVCPLRHEDPAGVGVAAGLGVGLDAAVGQAALVAHGAGRHQRQHRLVVSLRGELAGGRVVAAVAGAAAPGLVAGDVRAGLAGGVLDVAEPVEGPFLADVEEAEVGGLAGLALVVGERGIHRRADGGLVADGGIGEVEADHHFGERVAAHATIALPGLCRVVVRGGVAGEDAAGVAHAVGAFGLGQGDRVPAGLELAALHQEVAAGFAVNGLAPDPKVFAEDGVADVVAALVLADDGGVVADLPVHD